LKHFFTKFLHNELSLCSDELVPLKDLIDRLKEEIDINKNIDVCLFRTGYNDKIILPNNLDYTIIKYRVGISFVLKSYITKKFIFNTIKNDNLNLSSKIYPNINFKKNIYNEDYYYYLKRLEYNFYNIVISPYICYFENTFPYSTNKTYERIYINLI
jgi:hypothetical protein